MYGITNECTHVGTAATINDHKTAHKHSSLAPSVIFVLIYFLVLVFILRIFFTFSFVLVLIMFLL